MRDLPVLSHCPACGYALAARKQGQRIDRKVVLATYDNLPEKQVSILDFLVTFTVASQLTLADVFSDAASQRERKISISKHLASLHKHGLVERIEGGPRHNGKVFYAPTEAGMFAYEVERRGDTRNVKKLKQVKAHTLLCSTHSKHDLAVTEVMSSFVRTEREGRGELTGYWPDKSITYNFVHGGSRRKLQPDSTFIWSSSGQALNGWLEVENKKAYSDLFAEKVMKYVWFEYNERGETFRRTLATNRFPVLLVVAVRRGQVPGLRQAILKGVLGAHVGTIPDIAKRVVIGLACLDDVREEGVFSDIWEGVLQAKAPLSFPDLYDL